ncbi:acetyltransferase (GNAT) family protein [Cytobacillus oceanisediminis]|uniref:Acetyltransferase (GNAT) family protein n=1 Tax=Cytobacillus oceanisediminis TaxID=665099 RepID=A0A2V2ZTH9_9BACI|nr:GNAT family N-acetyltransferase [Cytobacillus oceanisediminis]PWW26639.1 acetyltransferase (GNAT) family protein [Cytobacillus oceanisediminis]
MDYRIRVANKKDLDGICAVRDNKELFRKYLLQSSRKKLYLIIAEQKKLILGFGVLKLTGFLFPKLSDLYVVENLRGYGIGSEIIRYRENMARKLGYPEIYVSIDPIENPKMINLVIKHGYKAISEPYKKRATFYNEEGKSYDKTYTRVDFKKLIG